MQRFLLGLIVLVGGLVAVFEGFSPPAPDATGPSLHAQAAAAPRPAPAFPQVIAWMPSDWDAANAAASLAAHQEQINTISPFWYSMNANGLLTARSGARDRDLVQAAHDAGLLVMPTISNSFDPQRVHQVLNDDSLRALHVQIIVYEVLTLQYDGIDIDYEAMLAADRDLFTQFIGELAAALHRYDRLLSVAVQAKTRDLASWDGVGALDYAALGEQADEIRVMTYGWCWRNGCTGGQPPGPIAPMHWVSDVMAYAGSQIPSSRLVMGIPLYGYDWGPQSNGQGLQGTALNWHDVQQLIAEHQPTVQWWQADERGAVQEHWFTYGDGHTVVYADYDSVGVRWALAQQMGLRGVALWYLGSDDPRIWAYLGRSTFPTPTPPPTTPTPTGTPSPTTAPTATPSPTAPTSEALYLPILLLKAH